MRHIIIFFLILICFDNYSQDTKYDNPHINSLYVEFLGSSGLIYNITYDRILYLKNDFGITGAIGLQYFLLGKPEGAGSIQINFIHGNTHYLEYGIGSIFFYNHIKNFYSGKTVPLRLGYRYQRKNGGFFFKIAFTPLLTDAFDNQLMILPWGGVSFGFTF